MFSNYEKRIRELEKTVSWLQDTNINQYKRNTVNEERFYSLIAYLGLVFSEEPRTVIVKKRR